MKTPKKTQKIQESSSESQLTPSLTVTETTARKRQSNDAPVGIPSSLRLDGLNQSDTTLSATYKTSDLHLAATLICQGKKVLDVEVDRYRSPGRGEFIFADTEELRKLVVDFYNSDLLVEPHRMMMSIRELKSMVSNT